MSYIYLHLHWYYIYIGTMNIYAREKGYKIVTSTYKFIVFKTLKWISFFHTIPFFLSEVCKTYDR